jgi:hypothetical protein
MYKDGVPIAWIHKYLYLMLFFFAIADPNQAPIREWVGLGLVVVPVDPYALIHTPRFMAYDL